jgi:DNA-binding response OmpR family regulator
MGGKKIMIVDDEPRIRKLLKDYLIKSEYSVIEASNGEDALDKFLKDNDISLIIMDVMMPKMDGYETSAEIRKTSDVPIIMLTAKSDEKDELKGFSIGVDEYITKPFSPKILVARVEAVLRRSSQKDEDETRPHGTTLLGLALCFLQ